MTNFERLTTSPEALAAMLAELPLTNSPWDEDFRMEFCAGCQQEDCEPVCPHQAERGNPAWWLRKECRTDGK